MSRLLRVARVLAVNVVLLVALCELVAVAWYFGQRHELFYLRDEALTRGAPSKAPSLTDFRVSPYFGFLRAPGIAVSDFVDPDRLARMASPSARVPWADLRTNNYGFVSRHDYPFAVDSEGSFVIAVVGGSVAQWFALQGETELLARLKSSPEFRQRELVVMNLSAGGYKQPQQLLVLAYFLALRQRIDYVVNIDGFNEIALARLNFASGVSSAMPSVQHMAPLARIAGAAGQDGDLERLAELHRVKRTLAKVAADKQRSVLAVGFLAREFQERLLNRRYDELVRSLAEVRSESSLVVLTPAPVRPEADPDGEAVELWEQSSCLIRDTLGARGIGYLHVVQPNQYFSRRKFGADEAKIALNMDSPYRKAIETGYPKLLERIPALRAHGVRVLDATSLFDEAKEPVYSDDCCHYNQRGNDRLAQAIAEAMLSDGRSAEPAQGSGSCTGSRVPAARAPR